MLLVNKSGDGRIALRTRQLFQQRSLFTLIGFQKSSKIILGKQNRTGKLFESQPDQFADSLQ
ncbi:hypothetical protein SDC9_30849 [bioreactor metagenome]|uniref:Uncharacterized protein n=1 Tax=bioreactor metagenome TaxID=1076179 RepID=A0A644V113_9ZZZZ